MVRERSSDRTEVAVLVACLLLSVLLFAFVQTQGGRLLTRAELVLLWPADAIRGFIEGVVFERRENEKLKQELTLLRTEQIRLQMRLGDTLRASAVRTFRAEELVVLVPARVIGTAGEPWPLVYHLSAGRHEGISPGRPVLAPEGLVGRIEAVDSRTSSAALLTDPLLAVACEVLPSGARGVLRFRPSGRPGLYLHHVPLTDTVHVGEIVATSGMSQLYPPGIPVGTVARVERAPGGLVQEIEVRPAAPFARLREVFVYADSTRPLLWSRILR